MEKCEDSWRLEKWAKEWDILGDDGVRDIRKR